MGEEMCDKSLPFGITTFSLKSSFSFVAAIFRNLKEESQRSFYSTFLEGTIDSAFPEVRPFSLPRRPSETEGMLTHVSPK